MKRLISAIFSAMLIFSFGNCTTNNSPNEKNNIENNEGGNNSNGSNEEEGGNSSTPLVGKQLILYYSFTNNIHTIANDLKNQLPDADILRVEPEAEGLDYAADNYALGSALIAAIRNNPNDASSYPAIKTTINNLEQYNSIIVCTPLWWSNMAAPMQTFLFTYGKDMKDKHIALIVSSGSSSISGVEADAKRLIPQGQFVTPSLWIRSAQTSRCHEMISNWLNELQ